MNGDLISREAALHTIRALCDTTDCNIAIMPDVAEALRELPAVAAAPTEQLARLQKAFALACRILGDSRWTRWQEHIMERVDSEQVCRVCGCMRCDACLGGCYWVEDDLCSQCAAKMDEEAANAD